jgi:hypothetical protein
MSQPRDDQVCHGRAVSPKGGRVRNFPLPPWAEHQFHEIHAQGNDSGDEDLIRLIIPTRLWQLELEQEGQAAQGIGSGHQTVFEPPTAK